MSESARNGEEARGTSAERTANARRVMMSDELFQALGASRVEWGEPDADGFYTPTVYADGLMELSEQHIDADRLAAAMAHVRPWGGNPLVHAREWARLIVAEYEKDGE